MRKGTKPEANALPPLPAPVIQPGPVLQDKQPLKRTAAQTREVKAALRKTVKKGDCELLDSPSDTTRELEVWRVTNDKLLA